MPALSELALPSLCVHGTRDLLVPWRRGAPLADVLGAVLVCIRGAGHLPYLTHARAFNAAVTRLVRSYRR